MTKSVKLYLDAGIEAGPEPLKYGCNSLSSFAEGVQNDIHVQVGADIVHWGTSRTPCEIACDVTLNTSFPKPSVKMLWAQL